MAMIGSFRCRGVALRTDAYAPWPMVLLMSWNGRSAGRGANWLYELLVRCFFVHCGVWKCPKHELTDGGALMITEQRLIERQVEDGRGEGQQRKKF